LAYRWRQQGYRRIPGVHVHAISRIDLNDLLCIDEQKQVMVRNTRQFLAGLPANNALYVGAAWYRQILAAESLAECLCYGDGCV
jgi:uncharacterized protein